MILKVAITGPESTGKSVLAEQLAASFKTAWVPEYAREFLEKLGRPYEEHDIADIARGQLNQERIMKSYANRYLFCDTDMLVTKIWSDVKYSRCDPWIEHAVNSHRYDLHLLCDIDLPWEYDPLREHPGQRQFLFDIYLEELTTRKFPFAVIRGSGPDRLLCARNAIAYYL